MTPEETIRHLNDLIAVARDGEEGYRTAAAHVNDMHYQSVFTAYAVERAAFARELQTEVTRLGGEPKESGTVAAAVHRGWLDLKAALSGGNAASIVAACETGEDSAEAAYERVVNLDISGEPRALIEKQWKQVKEAHQRLLNRKNNKETAEV